LLTDIEVAKSAKMDRIIEVAERLGIDEKFLEPYGHYKAKVSLEYLESLSGKPDGKLILVTAISPTPPGEGKTTTTIGLGDALNRIGKKAMICLREPSLGPVFGLKGGATGGGFAQVVPMEDINLHFTGDFGAIQLANNLLAALIDNHIHHGNALGLDIRKITWKRVIDMNDRALRQIVVSLGGPANGFPRQDSFDIVAASEVMAIICLATSLSDLKERLGNIVVGFTTENKPITARDLRAHGAMAVLLKDAIKPNLVQTMENTPAFVHGGPFANIAHGCNSVVATKSALKLSDYVVTEAGFGADLGAQKFIDIKCRQSGLNVSLCVIVATIRALKYHGGVCLKKLEREDVGALEKGLVNLERHLHNLKNNYNLPCVVAINHFTKDRPAEIALLQKRAKQWNVPVVNSTHWADGGKGAEGLARTVVEIIENHPGQPTFLFRNELSLWEKMKTIATKIYGASDIRADKSVVDRIAFFEANGYGKFPVCVAKTQYSFSTNAKLLGAPSDHIVEIREVRLSAGAGFVVMVCGDVMTMPGLPKEPASNRMDLDDRGQIVGLS
jgi:formate--tetrahydrofolate ligase